MRQETLDAIVHRDYALFCCDSLSTKCAESPPVVVGLDKTYEAEKFLSSDVWFRLHRDRCKCDQ